MDFLIVVFLINYFFIALAIVIGLIAVEWILFERAGEPGWKVLVPFYGSFIMHKITFGEDSKWYWFLILVPGYSFYMQYSFTRAYGDSIRVFPDSVVNCDGLAGCTLRRSANSFS